MEMAPTEETRQQFNRAFSRMLGLTNAVRDELIARRIKEPFAETDGERRQDAR